MRKTVYYMAALLFFLVFAAGAFTYSNALVENKVALTITDPDSGLISLVPRENPLEMAPDQTMDALELTNNLDIPISYHLECDAVGFTLDPHWGSLGGLSDTIIVTVTADEGCPIGETILPVTLLADFDGGSARITTELTVIVQDSTPDKAGAVLLGEEGVDPFGMAENNANADNTDPEAEGGPAAPVSGPNDDAANDAVAADGE